MRKIEFSNLDWETNQAGIRSKTFEQEGKKIRVVELLKELEHPEWCLTGHIGYVVEGELEIVFDDVTIKYTEGDTINISSGEEEKHIPKPLSDKVILFLIDEITL